MGVLPTYRGMNVAEWAALLGGPVGCAVHVIDSGIDTGDIRCVSAIGVEGVTSIAELRSAVDRQRLAMLGAVLRYAIDQGELPPKYPQTLTEGRQYFRMHPEITKILETRLRTSVGV